MAAVAKRMQDHATQGFLPVARFLVHRVVFREDAGFVLRLFARLVELQADGRTPTNPQGLVDLGKL